MYHTASSVGLFLLCVCVLAGSSLGENTNTYTTIPNDMYINTYGNYGALSTSSSFWVAHIINGDMYGITLNVTFSVDSSVSTILLISVQQYDSINSTAFTVFSNYTTFTPSSQFYITILQDVQGEISLYFGEQPLLSSPSVIAHTLTSVMPLSVSVEVSPNSYALTQVFALSALCAIDTYIPVSNQITPPTNSSLAFVVSFTLKFENSSAESITCKQPYGGINLYYPGSSQLASAITFTKSTAASTTFFSNAWQSTQFYRGFMTQDVPYCLLVITPYVYLSDACYEGMEYSPQSLLNAVKVSTQFVYGGAGLPFLVGGTGVISDLKVYPFINGNTKLGYSQQPFVITTIVFGITIVVLILLLSVIACKTCRQHNREHERLIQHN